MSGVDHVTFQIESAITDLDRMARLTDLAIASEDREVIVFAADKLAEQAEALKALYYQLRGEGPAAS